jgi:hypothetical protein
LNPHESGDDSLGHELVTIDPTIDHESGGDHGKIPATAAEKLGMQGELKGARHLVHVDGH